MNHEPTYPGPPAVFLQNACLAHRFMRTKQDRQGNVVEQYLDHVERPERLRAINIGLSALWARLESSSQRHRSSAISVNIPFTIVRSSASVDIQKSGDVRYVHGTDSPNCVAKKKYLPDTIAKRAAQGYATNDWKQRGVAVGSYDEVDLYLCPGSLDAMNGAVGTLFEAVDVVCRASGKEKEKLPEYVQQARRAFVAVRPPGHHCDRTTPAGFCYINNVVIAGVYAFRRFKMRRIVIFDIDLHHGNGTQRRVMEYPGYYNRVKYFYGGIYDPTSYPCNTAKGKLDAAMQFSSYERGGCMGVCNIPLQEYRDEDQFWDQYNNSYSKLFAKAGSVLEDIGPTDDVLVIISCGFDASEYEEDMSSGDRHVPTAFFHRFTRDACEFADKYASGRIISVLEGGYADRALISGTMAHVAALAEAGGASISNEWWNEGQLRQIEKNALQPRRRDWPTGAEWLERTQQIAWHLNRSPQNKAPHTSQIFVPPLLDREKGKSAALYAPFPALQDPEAESDVYGREESSRRFADDIRAEPVPAKRLASDNEVVDPRGDRADHIKELIEMLRVRCEQLQGPFTELYALWNEEGASHEELRELLKPLKLEWETLQSLWPNLDILWQNLRAPSEEWRTIWEWIQDCLETPWDASSMSENV